METPVKTPSNYTFLLTTRKKKTYILYVYYTSVNDAFVSKILMQNKLRCTTVDLRETIWLSTLSMYLTVFPIHRMLKIYFGLERKHMYLLPLAAVLQDAGRVIDGPVVFADRQVGALVLVDLNH